MKMQLFAIRDKQLDAFMQLWPAQTVGQAIRVFTDEMNNQQGQMYKHPHDYDLYHIGTFYETGLVEQPEGLPKQIAIGGNVCEK